jgi:hypothetical protein
VSKRGFRLLSLKSDRPKDYSRAAMSQGAKEGKNKRPAFWHCFGAHGGYLISVFTLCCR